MHIGPDRAPAVTSALLCTNHPESVSWPEMAAASRTVERHAALAQALEAAPDIEALAASLLEPPLHARGLNVFTAYTAIYRPAQGSVDYLWPGRRWRQTLETFAPGRYDHQYES